MNLPWLPSIRASFALVAVAAFSMILFAVIMLQYFFDLEPCALCISQRIGFFAIGAIALIGFIHGPKSMGQQVYGALAALASFAGGCISARHVWIQNLPEDQQPLCGPGLGYMFDTRPIFEAFSLLLKGDGNCSDILLDFMGLSIPGWTLVAFVGFFVFNIWIILRARNTQLLPS